jgi:PAP2 superfamily
VFAARDERPDAMANILSQDVEFFTDFLAVLTIRPGSHPQTWRVLNIASLIGSFAALYFKSKYDLPRPSQICPALLPPIPVPGHSSWPSGHSTQAHFMKNCMLRIFAGTAATVNPMPAADQAVLSADLTILADSIARNREIAGLHYPRDSEGGARIADLLNTAILTTGAVPLFDSAITAAVGEWS